MQVIESFQGFRPAPHKRTLFGVSVICSLGATWLLTKVVPETALYLTLEPCSTSDAAFVLAKVARSVLPSSVCHWCRLFAAKVQPSQQIAAWVSVHELSSIHNSPVSENCWRSTLIQCYLLASVVMCLAPYGDIFCNPLQPSLPNPSPHMPPRAPYIANNYGCS